ncbi:MAG: SIMPL domain-containing protein [Anaerolineae bacterium]|nr:SIMPL domain-containing protein [Anaerolineae bacterium]
MSKGRAFAATAITSLLVIALVLAGSSLSVGTAAQAQDTAAPSATRFITVVGQGKTNVEPDIATLNLGVQTKAAKVDEAMSENTAIMDAIMEALLAAGIEEKDIQTTSYNIYLDEGYRAPDVEPEPVYRVSNMVLVKVRDLEAVGEVLDAAVAAGANQIYGISFTLEDWSEAEAEARAEAMADARARAEELAGLAEVEVGEVLSISEVVGGTAPYAASYGVALERAAMGGGGAIAPGELEYSTRIQVTYALR